MSPKASSRIKMNKLKNKKHQEHSAPSVCLRVKIGLCQPQRCDVRFQ